MKNKRELIIDTDIYLKELGLDEVHIIYNALVKGQKYFSEWLPFVEEDMNLSDTEEFVKSIMADEYSNLTCSIFYQNQFVGLVGLKEADLINNKIEIGYWLSENYQKRGIMTRACQGLIDYAFDILGMNRIQLKAATGNLKSQQVAERLGFTREGVLRQAELHTRGYVDLVMYSLLKSERKK